MFGGGHGFYIQVPSHSKPQTLYPVKFIGTNPPTCTAESQEAGLSLTVGQGILIYFEVGKKFVKQSARIEAVSDDDMPTFDFVPIGEPVSAENRQQFRVSAVISDLTATLGEENRCKLLDVSASGFSVMSTQAYEISSIVDAALLHDGESYTGRVRIQSIRDLSPDGIRYGLYCVDEKGSNANLEEGLRRMSMDLQRKQLRRLSGKV